MKLILALSLLLTTSSFAQTYDAFYASLANSCNQDTVNKYLEEFEDLGIKEMGTSDLLNAKNWLIDKYTSFGYVDIVQDNFMVTGNTMTNIVVTKIGTTYPNKFVIIDGHYDTINGPGSNDNGTGTAIILEIARLLMSIPTEYSIKFIHFSGEEIGLTGSEHYVDNVVIPDNLDIKVVFNIDEVGGIAGMTNNTIVCERDQSPPNTNNAASATMTTELATCMELYSNLDTEISFAYGSDYVPFMNNGYVVTGLYEKNESPYVHSINDSLNHVDLNYVYELTKGSMGSLAHFAVAYNDASIEETELNTFDLFPNPAHKSITLSSNELLIQTIKIIGLDGRLFINENVSPTNEMQVDISELHPGAYIVIVQNESGSYSQNLIVQ
jgi:hypothetical protein